MLSDFIAAMALKPVILISQKKDFFDVREVEESYERLKNLWKLLGAEENIKLVRGSDYHGYSLPNREAMYAWFNQVTGISESNTEPILALEEEEILWCTPNDQVGESERATVFSITRQLSTSFKSSRSIIQGHALTQVTLKNALASYSEIAEREDYDWRLSSMLPGVLKSFDLPNCYRELVSKRLTMIEPWDGNMAAEMNRR